MDIKLDNYIEGYIRNLPVSKDISYIDFYKQFTDTRIQEIFSTFHSHLIYLFEAMNRRLPSPNGDNHYWAAESRNLLNIINAIEDLKIKTNNTELSFDIDKNYENIFRKCKSFLKPYGGSNLPADLEKILIPYKSPLFLSSPLYCVDHISKQEYLELKHIGEGSYAHVYSYHDSFYDHDFILKRAKKNLSEKEYKRFKQEFDIMQKLDSPYIVKVYRYNSQKQEYIMEKMDYTLEEFIKHNIQRITIRKKINIVKQIYKAFLYIHQKGLLHRDISPKNILIKEYDDGSFVVKISDFGLVQVPNSTLTTVNTELKGYCNDPELYRIGFNNYRMEHEIFALTFITGFVLTGKKDFSSINNKRIKDFLDKGMNPQKAIRYKNIQQMQKALEDINFTNQS